MEEQVWGWRQREIGLVWGWSGVGLGNPGNLGWSGGGNGMCRALEGLAGDGGGWAGRLVMSMEKQVAIKCVLSFLPLLLSIPLAKSGHHS